MIVADLQERIRLMLNLEGVEEDPAYKQSKHTVQEIINNINKIRCHHKLNKKRCTKVRNF